MVSAERYQEIMAENKGMTFPVIFGPVEVGLFHGALRLMLLHPEVEDFSDSFICIAERMREFCLGAYLRMGFSEEEVEYLDSAFEFDGEDPF